MAYKAYRTKKDEAKLYNPVEYLSIKKTRSRRYDAIVLEKKDGHFEALATIEYAK